MEWTVKGSSIGGIWIFPPYTPDNQGWEMNDGERILGAGKPALFPGENIWENTWADIW